MKTVLRSSKVNLRSTCRPLLQTREEDNTVLTCHVQSPQHLLCEADQCESREVDRQRNQVKRLFPEFFTHSSESREAESHDTGRRLNLNLERRLYDDPLIQSWLTMYGCN